MSKKEYVHVEVEPNKQLSVQMCCSPKALIIIIATMIIEVAKKRGQMSVRKMMDDIIWLTDSELKAMEVSESQKEIDDLTTGLRDREVNHEA